MNVFDLLLNDRQHQLALKTAIFEKGTLSQKSFSFDQLLQRFLKKDENSYAPYSRSDEVSQKFIAHIKSHIPPTLKKLEQNILKSNIVQLHDFNKFKKIDDDATSKIRMKFVAQRGGEWNKNNIKKMALQKKLIREELDSRETVSNKEIVAKEDRKIGEELHKDISKYIDDDSVTSVKEIQNVKKIRKVSPSGHQNQINVENNQVNQETFIGGKRIERKITRDSFFNSKRQFLFTSQMSYFNKWNKKYIHKQNLTENLDQKSIKQNVMKKEKKTQISEEYKPFLYRTVEDIKKKNTNKTRFSKGDDELSQNINNVIQNSTQPVYGKSINEKRPALARQIQSTRKEIEKEYKSIAKALFNKMNKKRRVDVVITQKQNNNNSALFKNSEVTKKELNQSVLKILQNSKREIIESKSDYDENALDALFTKKDMNLLNRHNFLKKESHKSNEVFDAFSISMKESKNRNRKEGFSVYGSQIIEEKHEKRVLKKKARRKNNVLFDPIDNKVAEIKKDEVQKSIALGNENRFNDEQLTQEMILHTKENHRSMTSQAHQFNSAGKRQEYVEHFSDQTTDLIKENNNTKAQEGLSAYKTTQWPEEMNQKQMRRFNFHWHQVKVHVALRTQSLHVQFIGDQLRHIDAVEQFIDDVMQEHGFDEYRIKIKDRYKELEFRSKEKKSRTSTSYSTVNVKA